VKTDTSYQWNTNSRQLYAMEASCPHLGADMSHAEIEECDDSIIAVCPWHRQGQEPSFVALDGLTRFFIGMTLIYELGRARWV
jgi:hypothetical protein